MNELIQSSLEKGGVIDKVDQLTRDQLGEVVFDENGENELYYTTFALNLSKALTSFLSIQ